ncbi:MAG TPA: serine/threonine protein kinase [Planctomycetaceae bacterium]|nr:serine/threonine protein kinase [Planctomycetaceae bacterium]HRF00759.1 PQQ-binding-like beta-propeller repeat protein [Pirellulaceae bacterium]
MAAIGVLTLIGSPAAAEDWARFRGPNGTGISTDAEPTPVEWSPTKNLKWKVRLPGPGSSSPIVVGDRVIVTCWSGYGVDRNDPGDQANLVRHLLCYDRNDGSLIWERKIDSVLPEDQYGGMFAEHGYASHTPVSDGQRIFAFFGKTGLHAFDMDGNPLWSKTLGSESDPRGWGSASSPILYGKLVIVPAIAESEALVALDQETGNEVWRQEAQGFGGTWGTPILVPVDGERTDLVMGVPYEIWAFNPETGKLRWFCTAMDTNSYCSSVVAQDSVVYGIEGRGGGSIAVKAGGSGDVTSSNVVWSGQDSSRIGTPLLSGGKLFAISGGVMTCIDAASGKRLFQGRLSSPRGNAAEATPQPQQGGPGQGRGGRGGGRGGMGGQDYSSPVAAGDRLYYVSRSGEMYVLKMGEMFEELARNRVTDEVEDFSATPAISRGALFIRSSAHLYCVAEAGS